MMPRPDKNEIDRILCERHTPEIHNAIKKAKIGIAGLGGLGSNIAAMLVRAGVSDLIIADHDVVEISNINRQNYCMDQIGMAKTDATEQQLMRINPFVRIKTHNIKLDRTNISDVFGKCDVVCEAFDIPSEKAMLINCLLEECPGIKIVAGSGMAGYGRSNEITTKKLFTDLYICGDGIDMEDAIGGLMSPRVNICAGHMANAVISILLEGDV
jgi:sulfur carrier protein ThiS adenylyltransferase